MGHQIIFGTSVRDNPPLRVKDPVLTFPGRALDGNDAFHLSESLLSRHLLLLGGSGCGKTNAFLYAVEELRRRMTEQDVAIIFDTKGEFYDGFGRPGDYLLGNSARFRARSHTWNLFGEVLADGWDDDSVGMNARELAAALFHDRGSSTQPFFCNAARDIFRGMVLHFVRQARRHRETWLPRLNNRDLLAAFQRFTAEDYATVFRGYPDLQGLVSYFGDGTSNQALGVFGELNSMLSEYFVGILAAHRPDRSLSLRRAVRERGGRAIFVEYDLSVGETLTPVYRLLVDQALKEALGRQKQSGKVYLIADEFKLLPKLQHIDDALNFGRGLGVCVMAGIQSIDQLYDGSSRDYISKRFGSNIMVYDFHNQGKNDRDYRERDGSTVEEWDQLELGLGQAVIGLGYAPPFLFQFREYGK